VVEERLEGGIYKAHHAAREKAIVDPWKKVRLKSNIELIDRTPEDAKPKAGRPPPRTDRMPDYMYCWKAGSLPKTRCWVRFRKTGRRGRIQFYLVAAPCWTSLPE